MPVLNYFWAKSLCQQQVKAQWTYLLPELKIRLVLSHRWSWTTQPTASKSRKQNLPWRQMCWWCCSCAYSGNKMMLTSSAKNTQLRAGRGTQVHHWLSMFMSGSSAIKTGPGRWAIPILRQPSGHRHSGKMHTHFLHSYPQAGKLYQACLRRTLHTSKTVRSSSDQTHVSLDLNTHLPIWDDLRSPPAQVFLWY